MRWSILSRCLLRDVHTFEAIHSRKNYLFSTKSLRNYLLPCTLQVIAARSIRSICTTRAKGVLNMAAFFLLDTLVC